MKKIVYIILLLTLLGLDSCIRDEIKPCPPLQVNIIVKDKNYFNVDKVALEERKSEDLAFREYVPTLFYTLRNVVTGEVIEEQGIFNITGDEKVYPITFCDCIPYGKYVLTVWGGLNDDVLQNDNSLMATLHMNNEKGTDLYVTNDTLVYNQRKDNYTVDLERGKGKLIIQVENLPDMVSSFDLTVGGLYRQMDCAFNYFDETSVHLQSQRIAGADILLKTVLAPSVKEENSIVSLNFYDQSGRVLPEFLPKNVEIIMGRNELTVMKYVYDEEEKGFTIYILVNDEWEMLHNMDID